MTPHFAGFGLLQLHSSCNRLLHDEFSKFKREHHPGDIPDANINLEPFIESLRRRFETNNTVKKNEILSRILSFKFLRMDMKTLDAFRRLLVDYRHANNNVDLPDDLLCQAFHQSVSHEVATLFLSNTLMDPDNAQHWMQFVTTLCTRAEAFNKRTAHVHQHDGDVDMLFTRSATKPGSS